MEKKILLLLAAAVSFSISAYQAKIHNCTGYNFVCEAWNNIGCKKINGIQLPRNTTTTISFGACVTKSAKFGVTIGNNPFSSGVLNMTTEITGSYDWFIFAESPIISVENPLYPGQPVTESKYVRFFLWKIPAAFAPKALFAVSGWYNTITGALDEAGAKTAGLKNDITV